MWAVKVALQLADSTVEGQRVRCTHNSQLDRVAVLRIYVEAHTPWQTACLLLAVEAVGIRNFLPMVAQVATQVEVQVAATQFTLLAVVVLQVVADQLVQ